jgi:two-component system NtrC family sensor kinase
MPQIVTAEDGSRRLLSSIVAIANEPDCWNASCHVHPSSQGILGVLDVLIPFEHFGNRIASGTGRLIALSVSSILTICLLITALARYQIVKPIKRLLDGTERVTEGHFDPTIPVRSRDELGALSRAFNKMTKELRSHDADLKRWVVTLEDKVEERTKELEKARIWLVQQEKMASLGRLSAGVAHEINNPLTSILVFSSILRDKLDPDHGDYKKISTIVNETIRCREIVERLLAFSRQDEPRKEKQDINEVINRSWELLKNQAIFQNIRIHPYLKKNLPEISVDTNQMHQVFVNILINAADAMPEGGDLTIRSRLAPLTEGRYVILIANRCKLARGQDLLYKMYDMYDDPSGGGQAEL